MHPVRRLTIPVLLLVAGCPIVAHGADGWLSIMVDGSIQPMRLQRTTDTVVANDTVVENNADGTLDLAWRLGVTALLRVPTSVPIRPVIGCSLSLDTIQHSEGGGESDTEARPDPHAAGYVAPPPTDLVRYRGRLWTWDLLFGLSYLANNHIIIDVLPFVGLGKGHATTSASYVGGDGSIYNPALTMREIGLRAGITFVSDYGMTFSLYGGYARRYLDEDGFQFDTINDVTTFAQRNDTTRYSGVVVGIAWGYTL